MPLTQEQITAMRAVPLVGDQPNRLRVALALTGAKQADVAAETGMQRAALSNIVTGKVSNIHVETARKIAEFFGCAIEDLFPRTA